MDEHKTNEEFAQWTDYHYIAGYRLEGWYIRHNPNMRTGQQREFYMNILWDDGDDKFTKQISIFENELPGYPKYNATNKEVINSLNIILSRIFQAIGIFSGKGRGPISDVPLCERIYPRYASHIKKLNER